MSLQRCLEAPVCTAHCKNAQVGWIISFSVDNVRPLEVSITFRATVRGASPKPNMPMSCEVKATSAETCADLDNAFADDFYLWAEHGPMPNL